MSDYPMLISNKLHSFRNFIFTNIHKILEKQPMEIKKYLLVGIGGTKFSSYLRVTFNRT